MLSQWFFILIKLIYLWNRLILWFKFSLNRTWSIRRLRCILNIVILWWRDLFEKLRHVLSWRSLSWINQVLFFSIILFLFFWGSHQLWLYRSHIWSIYFRWLLEFRFICLGLSNWNWLSSGWSNLLWITFWMLFFFLRWLIFSFFRENFNLFFIFLLFFEIRKNGICSVTSHRFSWWSRSPIQPFLTRNRTHCTLWPLLLH